MMRSIQRLAVALLLVLSGCSDSKPDYGFEQPLYLPGRVTQTWAVAPVIDLSGQRQVDPILQADLVYQQAQQVAGLNVIPVNRVVEAYSALRIEKVQSEEQAALVCDMLGCDALLVATVTIYDPYEPPKMGAGLTLFRKGRDSHRPQNIDPRELARRATPPPAATMPAHVGFAQVVGMFDAANGTVQADVAQYAAGRHDPTGAYKERTYLVDMDRFTGFVYHRLLQGLLAKMADVGAASAAARPSNGG